MRKYQIDFGTEEGICSGYVKDEAEHLVFAIPKTVIIEAISHKQGIRVQYLREMLRRGEGVAECMMLFPACSYDLD